MTPPADRRVRAGARALAATAAALTLLITGGLGAAAESTPVPDTADDGRLTWAVSPAKKDDQARALFNYSVEPGDVIADTLHVHVSGSSPIALQVYGSDAFLNDSGVFDVLPAAEVPRDLGSWIEMDHDHVTVQSGDETDIPFTLTVPANATPGDHVGGIVTSVGSDLDAKNGGTVRLDRRLGARVYVRVSGALEPGLTVSKPRVSYRPSANPFGGRTEISYTITNTGNVRVHARRSTTISELLGGSSRKRDLPELLPGSALSFTESLTGPRLLGPVHASVAVEPRDQLAGELPTSAFVKVTGSADTWALPWSQLLLLVLVLGLGVLARRRRRIAAPAALSRPREVVL